MKNEQQHYWVIDVIEEGVAAIEVTDGKIIHLSLTILPHGVKSGDVLRVSLDIDEAATKAAMADSAAQVKKISEASRKRDKGGDIAL